MLASQKSIASSAKGTMSVYACVLAVSWWVYDFVAGGAWTSILTLSAIAHCFGLAFLCVQIHTNRSAAGISARALLLDGLAVSMRLSSTLFYHGYLPSDKSGDMVYQLSDLCALALIIHLLYNVRVRMCSTYQYDDDDMRLAPMVVGAILLGAILHGDLNDSHIFDSMWLSGLFVSVVAALPQYWMISKSCGQVKVHTAHYMAATAVDRILSGTFMWYVRPHITCIPWVGNFQHTSWAVLLAHLVHLVLLSDFAYYYASALLTQGVEAPVLPLVTSGAGVAPSRTLLGSRRFRFNAFKV